MKYISEYLSGRRMTEEHFGKVGHGMGGHVGTHIAHAQYTILILRSHWHGRQQLRQQLILLAEFLSPIYGINTTNKQTNK
jgi:hypothetical protein